MSEPRFIWEQPGWVRPEPPHHKRPRGRPRKAPPIASAEDLARLHSWFKNEPRVPSRAVNARGRPAEDSAPRHIQRVRAAYCDEFVKTGNINTELLGQLREYANACRKPNAFRQRAVRQ